MAEHFGWRWAFGGMAVFGLILAFLYPMWFKENKIGTVQGKIKTQQKQDKSRSPLRSIYSSRSVIATYIGSGLQLFVGGTVIVWLPSYLNRYYGLGTDKAGWSRQWWYSVVQLARFYVGMLCDRLGRDRPDRKVSLAIAFCLIGCVLLSIAFAMSVGNAQLIMICMGCLLHWVPMDHPAQWLPT